MPGLATYNEALITDTDKARAMLGDTDTGDPLYSNAHIDAMIGLAGSLGGGVAALAEELIATYGRDPVRKSADGVSVDYSDRLEVWRQLAARARQAQAQASGTGSIAFVPANYTGQASTDEWTRPPDYWP